MTNKRAQNIGTVVAKDNGFEGTLSLMAFAGAIVILPVTDAEKDQKAPDYTVNTVAPNGTTFRIGSGWTKTAKSSGNEYTSICIDYFEITDKTIWANLVQDRDENKLNILV